MDDTSAIEVELRMNHKFKVLLLLFLLILSSGCMEEGSDARPGYVSGFGLEFDQTESNVSITGQIRIYPGEREHEIDVAEDVMVCAHGFDGTLQASQNVGTIRDTAERNVSMVVPARPFYLIVDHPKFSRGDSFGRLAMSWTPSDGARSTYPRHIDEFDYQPPTEPGECGRAINDTAR